MIRFGPDSRFLARALVGLLVTVMVACAPQPPAPAATQAPAKPAEAPKPTEAAKPAAQPVGNKQIVIGMTHDFKTFDPGRLYETWAGMAGFAMYEPLLQFEGEDATKPQA